MDFSHRYNELVEAEKTIMKRKSLQLFAFLAGSS